ncbi:PREDICTED: glucagon receptor-like [Pygoscelis adeliae]|uniref:glucagon receptor-like n=1 Tax=Pygoscelis adeliae TaxID=9238 RepID=UPI0004F4EBD0|nr:PREDICTED: glucagon receptor-like [Pygoscelis adeliae]
MRDVLGSGYRRSLVHLAWMCLISSVTHGGAKVLEKTFEEWMRYRDECLRRMASEPYPAGLFCNRTFDMYACWPDGSPGTAVNVSCPFYLPWFEKVKHGLVSRRCGADGQWVTVNGSQPWRDYSQCEEEMESTMEEEGARRLMVSFKVLYTVGYSLSLLTLAALGCRAAQVLMQYCILANHYWFLVEAVYLYKLLIGAVFSEKNYYRLYLYLGWVFLNSFQGFLVAVLYCFANKEVRTRCSFSCPALGLSPASAGGFAIPPLAGSGNICLATTVSVGILALTNQTASLCCKACTTKTSSLGLNNMITNNP